MRAAPLTRSVIRFARLAFAVVASVFIQAVTSAPVFANAGVGVQVVVPVSVSVGQVNLPGNIDMQNTSTPDALTVTVDTISLVPSCGAYSFITCTALDPNVLFINTPAIGRAGSACAGVTFTVAPTLQPDGSYTFTPASTIVLGPPGSATDKCIIDFTFSVLKAPTQDASGSAGIQTLPGALVSGTASDTSTAVGFGTAFFLTVSPASPAISTIATPGPLLVGSSISDTATLSGAVNPTGSITFNLYAPSDPTCAAPPVFTSSVPVSGNGSYPSASFVTNAVGIYHWIASYSGDANNAATAGTCGDTGESSVVTTNTPSFLTVASGTAKAGAAIFDTAFIVGVNPTGTITYNLYGPNDATCGNSSIFTAQRTVTGNGSYASATFTPLLVGTYRWIAAYSGDANNAPAAGACNDPNENVVITQATPAIATVATPSSGVIGVSVADTSTLSLGAAPTGTITFRLYGPSTTAVCNDATNLVFTSNAIAVAGNGAYGPSSPSFTPTVPGIYRWIASYSGDANNAAVAGACGAANETVTITRASPTLSTNASAGGALGVSVTDSANLAGGNAPTGTITFRLYGPSATNVCTAGNLVFTSNAVTVNGAGSYASTPSFTPATAGTYRWIATYSGDVNNNSRAGTCGEANESVTIVQAAPGMTTTASAGGAVGVSVTDSANLTGGNSPTGTITFRLYGPSATNVCNAGNLVFTSSAVPVNGNGNYGSTPGFAPTAVGTYRWIASYSGDANNAANAGACGDANETVVISQATPALVTQASAAIQLGGSVSDTATLSGGINPTGSITFRLYGPNDATCANAAVFTSNAVAVAGNGAYVSAPSHTPTAVGTYRWIASYSGDANHAAVAGACNDANESVVVSQATPSIVTQASIGGTMSLSVTDTATLSGGTNPTGSITFRLYGPNDATCANAPVFTSNAVPVNGNGSYVSAPGYVPTAAGTYRWIATYSGDAGNASVAGACNDPNEQVTITNAPGPPPTDVPIPTLSEWGLVLMSILTGLFALMTMRRRREQR